MTLTMSTYKNALRTSTEDTLRGQQGSTYSNILFNQIKSKIEDVFVVFTDYNEVEFNLSTKDLTETSKKLAMSSFSKEWDKENDDYWNKY